MKRCFLPIMVVIASLASGQNKDVVEIESIVEQFEKSVIEAEHDSFTFSKRGDQPTEEWTLPENVNNSANLISGRLKEGEKIEDIGVEISRIDGEIDQLEDSLEKLRASIETETGLSNTYQIRTDLDEKSLGSVQSMRVSLDGFVLYSMNNAKSLWLPSNSIPVYAGPLQPGSHKLRVDADFVMKQSSGPKPFLAKNLTQELEFEVKPNESTKELAVKIDMPDDLAKPIQAKFVGEGPGVKMEKQD